ncbi:uncharacterized protein [Procambarus clarkii]|uniref:uncharacterized protein n=1 Tax=Procambarus clarkii TaxID=6728 RepID=UPI001E6773CF|nr:uncharacterized protein LOC123761673 [Procambarus clarkii]
MVKLLQAVLVTSSMSVVMAALAALPEGDQLDTPEWLQNVPEGSKVAKYRKRRFLIFPLGSLLGVQTNLRLPLPGVGYLSNLALQSSMLFNLNNSTTISFGRSLQALEQRFDFYREIEMLLDSLGYNGHECTLRTICEVADLPFQHGLLGEVANLILSISAAALNEVESDLDNEYAAAEHYGRHHGSCHSIYSQCPVSFADFFTTITPVY